MKVLFKRITNIDESINIPGLDPATGKYGHRKINAISTIEHSGCEFTAIGFDTQAMCYIWPIEEFIGRWEPWLTTAEIKILKEQNPNGQTEGVMPLGIPKDLIERRHNG